MKIMRINRALVAMLSATLFGVAPFTALAEGCNAEEVGYVATFKVKAGSETAFESAITTLAETVRRLEPGAVLYAPFKGQDNTYYMMERYQDGAAREAHATSEEVRALFPTLGPHLIGAPDVQPVSAVCG